ncbi:hypothetical protein M501DRAFT_522066 [Patellaria atrata CBS 101060]|uniref:SRR1-like domain-containing protein n=1 Tax=Patellaria atrata CBS 101060 TaxID=1346257 RepID=A0A9P4VMD5_9PEZI|nr:hypothetical protein M501DRAFT_522066 [Patellaria atrata CBS 101060]
MPHFTSAKGGGGLRGGHMKRVNVGVEDGWTLVTHSGTGSKVGERTRSKKKRAGGEDEGSVVGKSEDRYTVAQLAEEVERQRGKIEGDGRREELIRALRKAAGVETEETPFWYEVDTAICLATGSLTRDMQGRWDSMDQIALFLILVDILNEFRSLPPNLSPESLAQPPLKKIRTIAQEPRYSPVDRTYLTSLGISVLEPPNATDIISPTTLVFVPFLEVNVLVPEVLKGKEAAAYVVNDLEEIGGGHDKFERWFERKEERGMM